jgi:hypothetical protein
MDRSAGLGRCWDRRRGELTGRAVPKRTGRAPAGAGVRAFQSGRMSNFAQIFAH